MSNDGESVGLLIALAALALALDGCGGDESPPCAELQLEASSAEWTAADPGAELCVELGAYLNGGLELGDPGTCPEGRTLVERRGGVCVAELEAACEGTRLELVCHVRAAGGADCDATVSAPELGGACVFAVAIR